MHCGLCTASCPTYIETCDENDSPRGRIYLMRAIADGRLAMGPGVREHLELCLDCRACESACPSGVQYGKMIEPFKIAMASSAQGKEKSSWLERLILHHLFPYSRPGAVGAGPGALDAEARHARFRRARRADAALAAHASAYGGHAAEAHRMERPLAGGTAAGRAETGAVALFLGCVADAMFPETNAATARVLQENGCEVVIPRGQVCCGAIHYHSGVEAPALELARKNLAVFGEIEPDAIIVNAAGCGAMLKDYAHVLPGESHDQAAHFVSKVKDISEFLVALGPIPPRGSLPCKVAYHDACHLCHGSRSATSRGRCWR